MQEYKYQETKASVNNYQFTFLLFFCLCLLTYMFSKSLVKQIDYYIDWFVIF